MISNEFIIRRIGEMCKEDILHYFQDINYMYNDCNMKDTLSKCLDEYAKKVRSDVIDEVKQFFISGAGDYLNIFDELDRIKEKK